MSLRFSKMHGAGNDFALIDLRSGQTPPDSARVRELADRHRGIGFDQLLTIETSARADCVAAYRIWNQDGSAAEQCGNGARCVAAWLVRDGSALGDCFRLDSPAGLIEVRRQSDAGFSLAMGVPDFAPTSIGLDEAAACASYERRLDGETTVFGAVSMGNPHALLVVDDLARAPVERLGRALQDSGSFREGVNVGFAQILSSSSIALRVLERGVGETLACGSGACAAVAILVRQGRADRHCRVALPGGTLLIDWPGDSAPVVMAGPATFVYEGEWL